jgi:hypothetical protein
MVRISDTSSEISDAFSVDDSRGAVLDVPCEPLPYSTALHWAIIANAAARTC